jgi:hypothetical protein
MMTKKNNPPQPAQPPEPPKSKWWYSIIDRADQLAEKILQKLKQAVLAVWKQPGKIIKTIIVLMPLLGGVVHQILMFFFDRSAIYVFVPPTYIYPLVALSYQWWILLVFGATLLILPFRARPRRVTQHLSLPVYLYLLFLLMLVKPIF